MPPRHPSLRLRALSLCILLLSLSRPGHADADADAQARLQTQLQAFLACPLEPTPEALAGLSRAEEDRLLNQYFAEKSTQLRVLEEQVRALVEAGEVSALIPLGAAYEAMVDSFLGANTPSYITLNPQQREVYHRAMADQAEPYRAKARDAYTLAVRMAEEAGLRGAWADTARARLAVLSARP